MENRLKLLAQRGVRNIDQYNRTFQKQHSLSLFENTEQSEHKPLPYLVIIIDELADLMMWTQTMWKSPSRGWRRWHVLWAST